MRAEGRRTGILWVPDWPILAAIWEGEVPAHLPSALCTNRGVVAVSAQARRLGVRPGMTQRTAQSLVPELVLGQDNPSQQVRAFEPVLAAAAEVTADISLLRPGLAMVGIEGAARYYGGEEAAAGELIGALAQAGFEAQVGAGEGLLTAIVAARAAELVPSGRAADFLAPHRVEELVHAATTPNGRREYEELVGIWRRLGLLRLGDVADLAAADVTARFGRVGARAHRLARGQDVQLRAGLRTVADLSVGLEFDPPAGRLDTAAFGAREVATELHAQLLRHGVACEVLNVIARTEKGEELRRAWRLDSLLSVEELTDRVRWQLAGWLEGRSGAGPSAPLVRIDLVAEGNYPAGSAQDGLWGARARSEAQAARAAERVQGLLGAEGVLTAVAQGGRTPAERVRHVVWGDEQHPERDPQAPWPGRLPEPLPTRVFPEPIEIELLGSTGPVRTTGSGGLTCVPQRVRHRRGSHPVQGWAGPWPISGRWWEGEAPRVYLQIVSPAGAWLVSGGERGWGVEGVYD